jgi:hypothetical protein
VGRRPPSFLTLAAVGIAFAAAPGCRDELGPERFPTTSASGVILNSGEPVTGGWIEFMPADGSLGNTRSARIQPDGTFHADRVSIGLNVIRLIDLPGVPPRPANDLAFVPFIRRTIPKEPGGPIRIDVTEELLRYYNAKGDPNQAAPREGEPRS